MSSVCQDDTCLCWLGESSHSGIFPPCKKQCSSLTIASQLWHSLHCILAWNKCFLSQQRCLFWKVNAPIDMCHASVINDVLAVMTPPLSSLYTPPPLTATTTSGNAHVKHKSVIFPQLQNACAATANTSVKCSVWRELVCSGVPQDSGLELMKDTWAYVSETWLITGRGPDKTWWKVAASGQTKALEATGADQHAQKP